MPFWFFKKKVPVPLDPVALRQKLIDAAASGSHQSLKSVCQQYKVQIAQNLDLIQKVPDELPKDDGTINRYAQCLIAVAQCLANDCKSPELWNRMTGVSETNPLVQFEQWFRELPDRTQRLEFDLLIKEVEEFIERAKSLRGGTARQHESYLYGRLGELLFHSGRVAEAIEPFDAAFDLCVQGDDVEGQIVYLNNLLEAHLYLDDGLAVRTAEGLLNLKRQKGVPHGDLQTRLQRLQTGEPLCRVVCVRDGQEMELNEIKYVGEGSYQFVFRRNRLPLQMATILTEQGNQLASSGQLADALEKYQAASEVDPYNPDPVYQSGTCLLELGAYAKAREAFEEVERLAPGWFRCRSDRWIASELESGRISDEEYRLLRILEDGNLEADQARSLVEQALERFPDFAPFYLSKGDLQKDRSPTGRAASVYQRGLELVEEPDLESRLLCALASVLPAESDERANVVERAVNLPGSLVAQATARLIELQRTKA